MFARDGNSNAPRFLVCRFPCEYCFSRALSRPMAMDCVRFIRTSIVDCRRISVACSPSQSKLINSIRSGRCASKFIYCFELPPEWALLHGKHARRAALNRCGSIKISVAKNNCRIRQSNRHQRCDASVPASCTRCKRSIQLNKLFCWPHVARQPAIQPVSQSVNQATFYVRFVYNRLVQRQSI